MKLFDLKLTRLSLVRLKLLHLKLLQRQFTCLLLLACCSCGPTLLQQSLEKSTLPVSGAVAGIPFIPQEDQQCGPAALAMVLSWAGEPQTPEQLLDETFTPGKEGSLPSDMLSAARRAGMLAYQLPAEPELIFHELAAGHPVIVLLNNGLSWFPLWHYAVLTGYDLPRNRINATSGLEKQTLYTTASFNAVWRRSQYWAMLVLPPGKLPAVMIEQRYIEATIGLERSGHLKQAADAYQGLLAQRPNSEAAAVGLSAVFLQLTRNVEALRVLEDALKHHPRSAALLNNYAEVLAAIGRLESALSVAEKAALEEGPHREVAERTLAQIKQRIAAR